MKILSKLRASRPAQLVVFAILAASGSIFLRRPATQVSNVSAESDPDPAAKLENWRRRVAELARDHGAAQTSDIAESRRRVRDRIATARAAVSRASIDAAAPFTGWKNTAWCVTLGAKDKVTGGHGFTDYTVSGMQPAVSLIREAQEDVATEIRSLLLCSLARANDYKRAALNLAQSADLAPPLLGPEVARLHELAGAAETTIAAAQSAAFAVALESVFFRATVECIGRVLGGLIAREAGTLAVAGGCAVGDGPLPIGDIIGGVIAIGGTAWTGWEIRGAVKAQAKLPREIEHSLRAQLHDLLEKAGACLDACDAAYTPLYTTR